ncbi:polysulfide reductase, NrfD [bacterium BMS3Abin09]|nr:polysulfide reductase, NrfD [bacterium BMS3Abin09]GBE41719.1 polysulfide reductase, NrfD [bacterium BMS3Bbin09]
MLIDAINEIFKIVTTGNKKYKMWMGFLSVLALIGISFVFTQIDQGLIATNMRDQVSWGWYIANFTFLVGLAAAAVVLVIPYYIYNYKPIGEIVLIGEIMAVAAVSMCLMFILLDMGSAERFWHLIPYIGIFNWPGSILTWDVIVLNMYLVLNLTLVIYALAKTYAGKPYKTKFIMPLIFFSVPAAISIHTVTAFLYLGAPARPFWNAAILAPRFIASAFCSGPAFMLIVFQIIRKTTKLKIEDKALHKVAEIVAWCMAVNLFLLGSEVFKEMYSATAHIEPFNYLWFGLRGNDQLVPWIWTAVIANSLAFLILIVPSIRKNFFMLNIACGFMFYGVYIEKGMGLIFPGFIPGTLGEIYNYMPNTLELWISLGVWAIGLMIFTVGAKICIAIKTGEIGHALEIPSDH